MPESKPKTPLEPPEVEEVDESSDESFPASDPPSWAMGKQADAHPAPAGELGSDEPRRDREAADRHDKARDEHPKRPGSPRR
jgi:hypothetical protein